MGELTGQLRSFLGGRRYAVLATHDPDGGIHLTPIWFLFEDDRFYFASSSGSRKVKNVERNFSASVVVDAREPGRERWVSVSGQVEILRDGDAQSINARIRRRYLTPKALDRPIEAALRESDDVTLRLNADGVAVVERADRRVAGAVVPSGRPLDGDIDPTTAPAVDHGRDDRIGGALVKLSCDSSARRAVRSLLTEREAVMVRLFVRINVADYETWRKGYDQFYGERVAMGVMGAAAFQLVDDPNDVTIWHDFETAEVARAFVSSDALRNVMQRAGVQGEPQIWFTAESWRPAPSFASASS